MLFSGWCTSHGHNVMMLSSIFSQINKFPAAAAVVGADCSSACSTSLAAAAASSPLVACQQLLCKIGNTVTSVASITKVWVQTKASSSSRLSLVCPLECSKTPLTWLCRSPAVCCSAHLPYCSMVKYQNPTVSRQNAIKMHKMPFCDKLNYWGVVISLLFEVGIN